MTKEKGVWLPINLLQNTDGEAMFSNGRQVSHGLACEYQKEVDSWASYYLILPKPVNQKDVCEKKTGKWLPISSLCQNDGEVFVTNKKEIGYYDADVYLKNPNSSDMYYLIIPPFPKVPEKK